MLGTLFENFLGALLGTLLGNSIIETTVEKPVGNFSNLFVNPVWEHCLGTLLVNPVWEPC